MVFLPPLLYSSAFFAELRRPAANLRAITLSAVGLVLATMCAVACGRARADPGMPWEAAFVLGAIVSPTDPLAAATIMRRLERPAADRQRRRGRGPVQRRDRARRLPRRRRRPSWPAASRSPTPTLRLRAGGRRRASRSGSRSAGSIAEIRKRTTDAQVSITISLLTGYAAFVPADALGASGRARDRHRRHLHGRPRARRSCRARIAAAGLLRLGHPRLPRQRDPVRADRAAAAGWSWTRSTATRPATLAGYAARGQRAWSSARGSSWLFTVPYLIRALDRRPSQRARRASAAWRLVVGWSGMRGAVSLAAALAHPARDRRRRSLPAARPDHLPDVRGDLLHARACRASRCPR